GHRVSHQKPNSTFQTHHAHYNTNIWCVSGSIAAELRMYINSTTAILADGTVVFAVCAAQSTVTSNPLVIPGDPNNDSYDRTSIVFGLGRVSGSPKALDDGHSSRVVNVTVSDYVRDETRASTVQYVIPLFRFPH
ncbi:hypothetical protein K438DRAFT_1562513, partial [Mycena galopus ATCC 62051]